MLPIGIFHPSANNGANEMKKSSHQNTGSKNLISTTSSEVAILTGLIVFQPSLMMKVLITSSEQPV